MTSHLGLDVHEHCHFLDNCCISSSGSFRLNMDFLVVQSKICSQEEGGRYVRKGFQFPLCHSTVHSLYNLYISIHAKELNLILEFIYFHDLVTFFCPFSM